ncbi:MAG TPA: shikimate kinase [Bacillota bacterium]
MDTNKQTSKNIVLIGFMGVGKTSAGKVLANKLDRQFVDTDEQIEKEMNMPTATIFEALGESAFRKKEKEVILTLCDKQNGTIISPGGGAFLQQEIREACLSSSIVIFLDLSWEAWQERLPEIFDSRPVLHDKSVEEMKQLFNERKKLYEQNYHVRIAIDQLSIEETAQQMITALRKSESSTIH